MTHTTLSVEGIDVLIEGDGPQTLLMLHGWPDTHRLWDATVDALKARHRCVRLTLPVDYVCGDNFSPDANTRPATDESGIAEGWEGMDGGPKSIALYEAAIARANTIIWNGPAGVFEFDKFAGATKAIAAAVAAATARGAITVVGGGDTATAAVKFGVEDKVTHCSTGGGASLEFLEGKELPGVAALDNA